MRSSALVLPALFFAFIAPIAAHATPVTYNLTGSLTYDDFQGDIYPDGSITGSFTVAPAIAVDSNGDGPITYESFTITDGNSDVYSVSGVPYNDTINSLTYNDIDPDTLQAFLENGNQGVVLDFSIANMALCVDNLCNGLASAANLSGLEGPVDFIENPVLTVATGTTPEPSSFILLGTGGCCTIGLLRRRRA